MAEDRAGFELTPGAAWMLGRLELDHIEQVDATLAARVLEEARQRLQGLLQAGEQLFPASRGFWLGLALSGDDEQGRAARVLDALGLQPFDLGAGQYLRRTASLGWAAYPWQAAAPEAFPCDAVQGVAWRALRLAQRSGRNQAVGLLPVGAETAAAAVRVVRTAGPDLIEQTPTAPLPVR